MEYIVQAATDSASFRSEVFKVVRWGFPRGLQTVSEVCLKLSGHKT